LGQIFGLQRGADVLVYGSIIFLLYFVLLLLSKVENNKHSITKTVRELAIMSSEKYSYKGNGVILVRVYNEAPVLQNTLESIFDFGNTNILIIDDGSTDESPKIIKNFARKHSHIISVTHSQNRGWWAALETWLEYVRRYLDVNGIITFDADGQHDIAEAELFKKAAWKYPYLWVIFWSRFLKKGSYENMPIMRRCVLKLGRVFTYIMSKAKLSDPHNWFRFIRRSTLDKISLTTDSMAYASELIEQIMQKKIPHAEIPVNIIYTDYSLAKWQKSSNAIFIALHTIWSKFFR
jgi:glycosyltransferase involved in cell wall biosynthesis